MADRALLGRLTLRGALRVPEITVYFAYLAITRVDVQEVGRASHADDEALLPIGGASSERLDWLE